MKKTGFFFALLLLGACHSPRPSKEVRTTEQTIHYNAFSHNDYTRTRPLEDALALNYNCVEADIHLIDGELYVRHERPEDVTGVPTLLDLYIRPLAARIRENGGRVYPGSDRPFFLMVDIKANGDAAYALMQEQLKPYEDIFCRYADGQVTEGPILLFFSGDRPMGTLPDQTERIAFLDGKFADMNRNIAATLMPVVSDNYKDYFKWNGEGEMPDMELERLRNLVKMAHNEQKKIRFWGAPDTDAWKRLQLKEGVDLIGEDNLEVLVGLLP